MRVLVCGGRNFTYKDFVFRFLNHYHKQHKITTLIHGNASGVDSLAKTWAMTYKIPSVKSYPANWKKHGKSAGFVRNQQMLDEGKPDVVIAFDGGKGTRNMITISKKANIPVVIATINSLIFDLLKRVSILEGKVYELEMGLVEAESELVNLGTNFEKQ